MLLVVGVLKGGPEISGRTSTLFDKREDHGSLRLFLVWIVNIIRTSYPELSCFGTQCKESDSPMGISIEIILTCCIWEGFWVGSGDAIRVDSEEWESCITSVQNDVWALFRGVHTVTLNIARLLGDRKIPFSLNHRVIECRYDWPNVDILGLLKVSTAILPRVSSVGKRQGTCSN